MPSVPSAAGVWREESILLKVAPLMLLRALCHGQVLSMACIRSASSQYIVPKLLFPWANGSHLSLAVSPEVDSDADQVVDGRIGALIEQNCQKHAQRIYGKSCTNTSVESGVRNEDGQWPLPGKSE
jgi:hypothetical protein